MFQCTACGYTAMVSGGDDVGKVCKMTTIVCKSCQKLYDVTTGVREDGYTPIKVKCPEVAKHRVARWTHPGTCPKCGQPMQRRTDRIMMWD